MAESQQGPFLLSRRRTLQVIGGSTVAAATGALSSGPAQAASITASPRDAADLVLHSGVIWTGVPHGPAAEAVAVTGQRVVAVGKNPDVLPLVGSRTRVIDLNKGFVVPGFRDQHTHLLTRARSGGSAEGYRPSWTGHDEQASFESRRRTGQSHVETKARGASPLDESAHSSLTEQIKSSILVMQEEAVKQGVTTVVEAGLRDMVMLDALNQLAAEDKLKLRFLIRVAWGNIEEAARLGLRTGVGNEWVKILGVKLYSDGWLGPRTCALRQPFDDDPYGFPPEGILFLDQDRANRDVARAAELGFNITAHAIGDRGVETCLNAYDHVGVTPNDRWALEHVQVAGDDLMFRMADKGVIASIQFSFATSDHYFAEKALGVERARRESYRWKTMLRRGVRLAGGSDFNIETLDPLWGLQRVVTRREFDGTPPSGFIPSEGLTLTDALQMITFDDAYASFEEADRGTIEVGKYADFSVTRENLLTMPRDCIASATRILTVVNGRIAFEGSIAYPPGDATCRSGQAAVDCASAGT
jgi:predicted amidohydrolase YtcJ